MTTNDAAAAWTALNRGALAVLLIAFGAGLAGCETSNSLLPQADQQSTQPQAQLAPQKPVARLAMAPISAPPAVAQQIQTELTSALAQRRIVLGAAGTPADYTVYGLISPDKTRQGVKVIYIWDLLEPSGKRVNRVTGEEQVAAVGDDPWAAMTPEVIRQISEKGASSIASWLPGAQPAIAGAAPGGPAATGASGLQNVSATAPVAGAPAAGAPAGPVAGRPAAVTTGSIAGSSAVLAMVPSVAGAPGDGSTALARALQKELSRNGVTLANATSPTTYRVEGRVAVGQAQSGKQPIQIDWLVKDPQGRKLGTVTQKNEIPAGSLDGAWGDTADTAAVAAAQGILKLLPQPKAVN